MVDLFLMLVPGVGSGLFADKIREKIIFKTMKVPVAIFLTHAALTSYTWLYLFMMAVKLGG